MSDAAYRRELELELERLARELADVRMEKAQQRQRIEQLQQEQCQLQDQLGQKTAGDKELRTDLAQQLQTLHQVVRQKKSEHCKVKQEWERSKEQYDHLRQTVDLFPSNKQDDEDDDMEANEARSRDVLKSLMDSSLFDNSENAASRADDASLGDNDTVITEHTKDSLQLHRMKQQQRRKAQGDDANGGGGGLSKFFSKQEGGASLPPPASSSGSANKLGSFLENDGKKPSKSVEKDLRSASE
ncbi:hypothetical protein MHU86_18359 [Fragilaria crotonensis]|nr:hypothetical protein MHU86_18359 [Fragilaria crotonensis]